MNKHQPEAQEEDEEPLPKPLVTYTILAIIWILFFAMAKASGWQFKNFPEAVADLFGDKENSRMVLNHHLLQWWRFLTPIFLHGGLLHVCVNSYSLYIMGRQLEPFYGPRRYFIIFITAGFTGVLASYLFSQHPSLGASGALFGLLGAGIVFPLRFRSLVPREHGKRIVIQLVKVAAINLAIGFTLRGYVDNSAHVGGLLGGGFSALFLLPDALDDGSKHRLRDAAVWASCGALCVLLAFSAVAQACWAMGPWWRVNVPSNYHAIRPIRQFEGRWESRDGSTVEIIDTAHRPALIPFALYTLQRTDIPSVWRKYNGALAKVIELNNQQDTIEVHLVLAYKHIIVVTMHSSTAHYPTAKTDFARIVQSLKFLHEPPPDLHPIPVPKPTLK